MSRSTFLAVAYLAVLNGTMLDLRGLFRIVLVIGRNCAVFKEFGSSGKGRLHRTSYGFDNVTEYCSMKIDEC